ncbi:hypothetical protein [Mycobacterium sp. ACS1612]|uniref:hypothetical protein n=1 Tax=Mycobacterium sp. ACS1612 TaxID=1834117 RepID=UPI0012E9A036|nr:hypothetical protein [Mycobacterium sp. ACS1612]
MDEQNVPPCDDIARVALMWSKIDDKLHSSQQQRTAGLEGMGLWTLGESYCGDPLTDGFIPAWFVIEKVGKRKGIALADRLVAAGLWETAEFSGEKGWNSVGFLPRNWSREKVLAEREKTAKRQAAWRERQKDDGASNGVSNDFGNAHPDQTRPEVVVLLVRTHQDASPAGHPRARTKTTCEIVSSTL